VSIISPIDGMSYAVPATILIVATASDSDGTVAKVDFYQGGTLLGSATTAPYSFTWNDVPDGTYILTAKATDNKGAVTTSDTVNVVVKANIPLVVSITGPANGTSYTGPATINITADASDSSGSVTEVSFYEGDTLLGIVTTTPYAYTLDHVLTGTYSFTVKAKDNNGVVATSDVVHITVNPPGASSPPRGPPPENGPPSEKGSSLEDPGTQADQVGSTGNTQGLTSTPTVGMVGTAQGSLYANVPVHSEDSVALGNAYSPLKMAVDSFSKIPSPSSSDHPSSLAVSPSGGTVSSGIQVKPSTEFPYRPSQFDGLSSSGDDGLAFSPVPSSVPSVSGHQPQVVKDKEDTSTHLPLAMSIISPKSGASYPEETPIPVEVTVANIAEVREVRFYDGQKLLKTFLKPPYAVTLNLKTGTHILAFEVTGADGVTASKVVRVVTVKSTWSGFFKNFFSAIKGFFTSLF